MDFQFKQKNVTLILNLNPNIPQAIYSDAKRFKQVLFNLLGNAVKFTFKGSVTLDCNYDQMTSHLFCSVTDTGIGIQPDDLEKLFKYFGCLAKSRHCNRGGLGLGLTISKMIVQEFGGEITVESQFGKGSKFSFWIPIEDSNKINHEILEQSGQMCAKI